MFVEDGLTCHVVCHVNDFYYEKWELTRGNDCMCWRTVSLVSSLYAFPPPRRSATAGILDRSASYLDFAVLTMFQLMSSVRRNICLHTFKNIVRSMSCNYLTQRLQIFRLHDKKFIYQAEYGYNWAQWNEVREVCNTGRGGYLLEFFSYQGRGGIYMWHASWDHCLAFSSLPQQSLPLCPDIRGGTPLSGAAARNDYIA